MKDSPKSGWKMINSEINDDVTSRRCFYWMVSRLRYANDKVVEIWKTKNKWNDIVDFNWVKYRVFWFLFNSLPLDKEVEIFKWEGYILAEIEVIEMKYWKKIINILKLR